VGGAIEVRGVAKTFRLGSTTRKRTVKELLVRGFGGAAPRQVWDMRDISFSISPGPTNRDRRRSDRNEAEVPSSGSPGA
jgi:hypothetical protein